ncbi:MAG: hypothetical protein OEY56_10880 [Cyclobacteriaceae bacterium]|nr:hypothetical protein [Cyclobacteriaceae bacterium]
MDRIWEVEVNEKMTQQCMGWPIRHQQRGLMSWLGLWLCLACTLPVYAQEMQDTLFFVDLHYESDGKGPGIYLYPGDVLTVGYTPAVGKVSIDLEAVVQGMSHSRKIELVSELDERWIYDHPIYEEGCYRLLIKNAGKLGYYGGEMAIFRQPAAGKGQMPTTCSLQSKSGKIVAGKDRILTFEESGKLTTSPMAVQVKKNITSRGHEYCEATFTLGSRERALIRFRPDKEEWRTHILVYRQEEGTQSIVLSDYQYSIDAFAFESLSGGTYIVQFWGREIFKRTGALIVERAR